MADTRVINENDVYVVCNDADNNSDVMTLFCFKPDGDSYRLDKINLDDEVKSKIDGGPPFFETQGTVESNASFTIVTHHLKKDAAITTANGKVTGTNTEDEEVIFKLGHIVWIENDPNGNSIAYGVVLVEEQ